ncbi:short-chain dehydrogenase [Ephemerocybe angulata]|uniref:Short-chain dehydrogenase n=1 Tax=Ephemerocybe angulata TaxID=980116 RepID=A0A8H6HUM8_9AGAR|nr:short-chain dehydrogenase [Tulosesus angulatus]
MKKSPVDFIRDQFAAIPPAPTADLSKQTVLVVGANTGLGFECTKHLARMNPGRLILACRSEQRGRAAITTLQQETGYRTAELWLVDLSKFSSVIAFADKFEKDGGRLDIVVMNAAIETTVYETSTDGWESTLQVNALSTSLLSLLLAPRLVDTAKRYPGARPRLVIVGSEVHYWVNFPEEVYSAPSAFEALSSKEYCTPAKMEDRYRESKLLVIFFTQSLAELLKDTPVIVNTVNPGYCYSELSRTYTGIKVVVEWVIKKILGRSTENGSRQLVYAAVGGAEDPDRLRGAYLNLYAVNEPSDHMLGEEGKSRRDKLWKDLIYELTRVDSRVRDIVRGFSA